MDSTIYNNSSLARLVSQFSNLSRDRNIASRVNYFSMDGTFATLRVAFKDQLTN